MFNSYTYKDVLTRASTTIQIIDDTTLYKARIFSSNGNIFNINDTESQLTLFVQKGLEDITDNFTDIVWSRFSSKSGQYEEDLTWGEQHKGKKSITLYRDDILEKANIQVAVYAKEHNERVLIAADFVSFIDLNDFKGSPYPPENPRHGDIWIDTSVNPPRIMMWDDKLKQWVEIVVAGNERRNLIRNSNFYKKSLDFWSIVGSPKIEFESFSAKKWARLICNNNATNGISQTVSASAKNIYSFQMLTGVYLHSSYPTGKANITINSLNQSGQKTLIKEQLLDITTDITVHDFNFSSLDDTVKLEVIISNYAKTSCDFVFTNIKLERYPIATDWEIAIEDIQDALDNKVGNTHDEVFGSLTNDGQMEGLYTDLGEDGKKHFYFNASYIKSGYITGDHIDAKNLTVARKDGIKTLEIDENGNIIFRGKIEVESAEGSFSDPATVDDIAYKVEISSANGFIFYNGNVSTILTAKVYKGKNDVTNSISASKFKWTKILENGTIDEQWGKTYGLNTKTVTVTKNDIIRKSTFQCEILE